MPISTSHWSWPGLTRSSSACGSGRLDDVDAARLLDLFLGAVADEDRLAAPEHLDDLTFGDRASDRPRSARRRRSSRHPDSSARSAAPAPLRRRPRRPRRLRCRGNRGVSARPKLLSQSQVPLWPVSPPARRPANALPASEGRCAVAVGPAAPGPGEGRKAAIRRRLLAPLQRERKPAIAAMPKSRTNPLPLSAISTIDAASIEGRNDRHADRPLRAGHPAEHRHDSAPCACLGVEAHIIEPAGFPTSDRAFRRAGMDYLDQVAIARHASWAAFEDWRRSGAAAADPVHHRARHVSYLDQPTGPTTSCCSAARSAGVPDAVHQAADARLLHPDAAGFALDQCGDGRRHGTWARRCGRRTAFPA